MKYRKEDASSELGFSLVEVVIVGGIASMLALFTAEQMNWQGKAARSIAASFDRDSIKTSLTQLLGNSDNCGKILGATINRPIEFVSHVANLSDLRDVVDPTKFYLQSNRAVDNSQIDVGQIFLDEGANPAIQVDPTGVFEKRTVDLIIPILRRKVGNSHAVGGDLLKKIGIKISITTRKVAPFDLVGCAVSESNCSAAGTVLVNTDTGTSCRKVACGAGEFNAGVYATAVGTHNVGDAVCVPLGKHVAGTLDGNPIACNDGEHLDAFGACTSASVCQPGYTAKSVGSDGSAYCCMRYTNSNPGRDVDIYCPSGTRAEDPIGGCAHSDPMRYVRSNGVRVEASCDANNGVNVAANCCKNEKVTFVRALSPSSCPTGQLWNGTACVNDPNYCSSIGKVNNGTMCVDQEECQGTDIPNGVGGCMQNNDPCPGRELCPDGSCQDVQSGCGGHMGR